jgi:cytochrome c-type biogenesis protein CcmE
MRHPTRSLVIGSALIIGVIGVLIYQGLSNNLVYYITPSELLAKGNITDQSFRLGGQVRPGSVQLNPKTRFLRFVLQDPKASVEVVSHDLPPQMFRAGIGVVVEGIYTGKLFSATNLMVKHSNAYRAPRPGQTPVPDTFVDSPSQ